MNIQLKLKLVKNLNIIQFLCVLFQRNQLGQVIRLCFLNVGMLFLVNLRLKWLGQKGNLNAQLARKNHC